MDSDYQTLKVELLDSGILQITLNRPDALNALNTTVLREFDRALIFAEEDQRVRGILVTGAGKAFCAGADITGLADIDASEGLAFAQLGQNVFRRLETLGKPSIAAVNGYAFGGGCELTLAATIRIASERAKFGQPEVKLGVIPGYGGTQRLPRIIGKGRALDLCVTGRFIDAETALNWGLISEICTIDSLIPRAVTILQDIFSMAPLAVKSVIDVIDQGFDLPLEDALNLEASEFSALCGTEDKNIGVQAFLNKDKPIFKNK